MTSQSHAFGDTGGARSQAFSAPQAPAWPLAPKSSLIPAAPAKITTSDTQGRSWGMGPGGLRSCPSIQLRRYCCLGKLRQKVTKTDKWLYSPNPAPAPASPGHMPQPETPVSPRTPQTLRPHSHRLRLLPALCSPGSHPAGSGPNILPVLPISWLRPGCLSVSLTCRVAPASPLPFILHTKPSSQNISLTTSFPYFGEARGSP